MEMVNRMKKMGCFDSPTHCICCVPPGLGSVAKQKRGGAAALRRAMSWCLQGVIDVTTQAVSGPAARGFCRCYEAAGLSRLGETCSELAWSCAAIAPQMGSVLISEHCVGQSVRTPRETRTVFSLHEAFRADQCLHRGEHLWCFDVSHRRAAVEEGPERARTRPRSLLYRDDVST